ncbi:hypothetical protein P3W53_12985 [Pseudomonas denitrificans (nom. rej.)]|nr:hypothetical protein [Pseudomonas denitrificans (nom. rej.)]
MFPLPFLDWAVWASLDQHRDIELILLKGHLSLEVFLSIGLSLRTSLTDAQIKSLSFSAKARTLAEVDEQLFKVMAYVSQLNKLRNTLAHEPFPEDLESDLYSWSERVLSSFSIQKHQKYTRRTKVTQAIAALARNIYELSHIESKSTLSTTKNKA